MPTSARSLMASGVVNDTVAAFGRAIVNGDFPAGSLLPKEQELADHFDVGRSTLREAVKVLSAKGMVRTARRYGSRICARDEWNLLDPDVLGWHMERPEDVLAFLEEITEVRMLVEPEAAALAARRATRAEVARLTALAEVLLTTEPSAAVESDIAFHVTVLNASHNRLLSAFGRSFAVLLKAHFELSQHYLEGPSRYRPDDRHLRLAQAIADRDAERAKAVSEDMLRFVRRSVRAAIKVRQGLAPARHRDSTETERP